MKRLLFGTMLLALVIVAPGPTMAQVGISVSIGLPPPIVFQAPPAVIVLPDTNSVYVVPDIAVDLFFWNGWWWRPWEGRWYRSRYYNRGWGYYSRVPSFYFDVDPGWRGYYRDQNWYGHRWDYQRIPPQRLQQNWKSWQNDRHWERQGTWGVQNYHPRPQAQKQELRQQRQQQYQQRPEVQQHQQQRQQRQKPPQERVQRPPGPPQVQQPRPQSQEIHQQQQRQEQRPQAQQPGPQPHERGQRPQKQEERPQAQQPEHSQPQGRPEGGEGERRK